MKNLFSSATIAIVSFILGMIIISYTYCGCIRSNVMEGMEAKKDDTKKDDKPNNPLAKAVSTLLPGGKKEGMTDGKDMKKDGKKEGFQVSQPLGYGPLDPSAEDNVNLSRWVKAAERYAKGMGNEDRLDSYKYHQGPPIPLPEGELFFFKDTKFSPECCPGTYSNSMGCSCMSQAQFNYLVQRGGNRTLQNTEY